MTGLGTCAAAMRLATALALSLIGAPPLRAPVSAAPVQSGATAAQYWCPMHPDQRLATRGTCPICGMALVRMPAASFVAYPVDLRATPTVAGVRLRLAVQSPSTQIVVRRFGIVHERPMHLFVVGDGLKFFAHEHPVQQPDGVFMLDLALPRPGPYMAIAEFLPEGGSPQMFQQAFTTGAALDPAPPPARDETPKTVDGMRVGIDAAGLRSGRASPLAFTVENEASGAPVTDLEPYLGARAHLLIVSADLTEAIHAHPDDAGAPGLTFAPIVPRPGRYKLWIQIQRGGHVSTASFVVEVKGS